jgi:hypothetical protein
MTIIKRSVIVDNDTRRPDYNGAWSLLADHGDTMTIEVHDVPNMVLATLLAVLEVATVQDAANAVGLTPDDLIHEAQAWEAAETNA